MQELRISSRAKRAVIDITDQVGQLLPGKGAGILHVFIQHTTAAVTAADLDPGTDQDLLDFLAGIVPSVQWRHAHDPAHVSDHLLASLVGPDVSVPFENGELQLGTWQRIILIEFDGPRERQLQVTVIKEDGDE